MCCWNQTGNPAALNRLRSPVVLIVLIASAAIAVVVGLNLLDGSGGEGQQAPQASTNTRAQAADVVDSEGNPLPNIEVPPEKPLTPNTTFTVVDPKGRTVFCPNGKPLRVPLSAEPPTDNSQKNYQARCDSESHLTWIPAAQDPLAK